MVVVLEVVVIQRPTMAVDGIIGWPFRDLVPAIIGCKGRERRLGVWVSSLFGRLAIVCVDQSAVWAQGQPRTIGSTV